MWLCWCANLNDSWKYDCKYCGRTEDEANQRFEEALGVSELSNDEYSLGNKVPTVQTRKGGE